MESRKASHHNPQTGTGFARKANGLFKSPANFIPVVRFSQLAPDKKRNFHLSGRLIKNDTHRQGNLPGWIVDYILNLPSLERIPFQR